MWLRRRYRFVIAAEMCHAWTPFGGIAAQLNHIAVLLSLATLENAGFAIRYHDLLVSTLADFARARFTSDYHTALSEVHEDTRRAVTRENNAPKTAPTTATPTQGKGKGQTRSKGSATKGKGKGTKGGKKGGKRSKGDRTRPGWKGASEALTAPPAGELNQRDLR